MLGSHVGLGGKEQFLGSVKEALSYGADTFMVYTGAPQNTRRKDLSEMRIPEAQALMGDIDERIGAITPEELEMDLFRHAAHLTSDELIMVKAFVHEDWEEPVIRFGIAAIDANNASFRENLTRYVTLINDGRDKMHEIYAKLLKERKEASLPVNPYLPAKTLESKVTS